MKLRGFFVTGTDTGVGKTAVTAALLCLLKASGRNVVPVKPVQTGVAPGEPGDLDFALTSAGMEISAAEHTLMNPYRFRTPVSPHLAAEQENVSIDPANIIESCRKLAETRDYLLVESAGGLLVPLTRDCLTLDLARQLALPLIIVARAALGTINHTLLTTRAARSAGLEIAAVVLNRPEPTSGSETERLIEQDNCRTIEELGTLPVFGPLPHIQGAGVRPEPTRELARALAGPCLESLLSRLD